MKTLFSSHNASRCTCSPLLCSAQCLKCFNKILLKTVFTVLGEMWQRTKKQIPIKILPLHLNLSLYCLVPNKLKNLFIQEPIMLLVYQISLSTLGSKYIYIYIYTVEGLNVINGPKCNKVLKVITFCRKCNKLVSCKLR